MANVSATEFRENATDRLQKRLSIVEQGTTLLNAKSVSGSNAAQAPTLAGVAGQRVTLSKIIIFASASASVTLTVNDGSGVVVDYGTVALTTESKSLDLLLTAPFGNTITVNVGAAGVGNTTTISLLADRT